MRRTIWCVVLIAAAVVGFVPNAAATSEKPLLVGVGSADGESFDDEALSAPGLAAASGASSGPRSGAAGATFVLTQSDAGVISARLPTTPALSSHVIRQNTRERLMGQRWDRAIHKDRTGRLFYTSVLFRCVCIPANN